VPKIEIRLGTIVRDIDLSMLERAHRPRIHVDVGIQLHHRDLQAAGLEERRERSR
jgi:hypothetical protein